MVVTGMTCRVPQLMATKLRERRVEPMTMGRRPAVRSMVFIHLGDGSGSKWLL